MKEYEDYVTDADGTERHPAFGLARFNRIRATPGAALFQSDIPHSEYIQVTLSTATRKRNLNSDRVHPEKTVIQFSLSLSQFASFITSADTEGVPVTIGYDHGSLPGLKLESRLAFTTGEARAAAHDAFAAIQAAEAAYGAALSAKPPVPAAERKRLWGELQAAIRNSTPNVEFAAKQLTKHAEDVAAKMRADIEAMVAAAQGRQLSVEAGGHVAAVTEGA